MKRYSGNAAAICLALVLCLSLTGCNLFATMRKNAEEAANTTLAETPGDDEAFAELNAYIEDAFDRAVIAESVSYKAGRPSVKKGDDSAGLLNDAAGIVKDLIMKNNPGGSSRTVEGRDDAGLIAAIQPASVLAYEITRNVTSERVTNEKGDEMLDEEGEFVTELHDSDNNLNFFLKYYSTSKNAEGEDEFSPAPDSVIEGVFGELADKEAALAAFDCVEDYIKANDYTVRYGNCEVRTSVDMVTGEILSLEFTKRMLVTAEATGVGSLEKYGDFTVEFELTKTTSYSFDYHHVEG